MGQIILNKNDKVVWVEKPKFTESFLTIEYDVPYGRWLVTQDTLQKFIDLLPKNFIRWMMGQQGNINDTREFWTHLPKTPGQGEIIQHESRPSFQKSW